MSRSKIALVPEGISSASSSVTKSTTSSSQSLAAHQVKRIDVLEERISKLQSDSKNIEEEVSKFTKVRDEVFASIAETRRANNFMTTVTYVVLAAFSFAFITLCFDYFKGNNARFENYSRRIDRIELKLEFLQNEKATNSFEQ